MAENHVFRYQEINYLQEWRKKIETILKFSIF